MSTTKTTAELFPEHRRDLEASGLSPETIVAAGLYSLKAIDLEPVLGWVPPVDSGLVFPYPHAADFVRVKVFPPFHDADGHTVKYLQRAQRVPSVYPSERPAGAWEPDRGVDMATKVIAIASQRSAPEEER
jgi:hypothetical protein